MTPWQQRVIEEKAELDARRDRLELCLNDEGFIDTLTARDVSLLFRQREHMKMYSLVLELRIAEFK